MQRWKLAFAINLAAIVSAALAAAAWLASAAVPLPTESELIANSTDMRIIAEALLDQSTWSRIGAASTSAAICLHVMAVIV